MKVSILNIIKVLQERRSHTKDEVQVLKEFSLCISWIVKDGMNSFIRKMESLLEKLNPVQGTRFFSVLCDKKKIANVVHDLRTKRYSKHIQERVKNLKKEISNCLRESNLKNIKHCRSQILFEILDLFSLYLVLKRYDVLK